MLADIKDIELAIRMKLINEGYTVISTVCGTVALRDMSVDDLYRVYRDMKCDIQYDPFEKE